MEIQPVAGALILLLWLSWYLRIMLADSKAMLRRNIVFVQHPIWIGKWLGGLRYLWKGPEMLLNAHLRGVPYAIRTPETYYVHFSSEAHIKQLAEASEKYLSLHALSKDMFQPRYTMNGLEVDDRMSANGSIHLRVLQVELRSHLRVLQRPLSERIAAAFSEEIMSGTPLPGDWRSLQSFPVAKRLITAVNSLVFFGPEVAYDPAFLKAALDYPDDLMMTAEALRFLPACLASLAAPYLMRRHEASTVLVDRLTPLVEQRLRCAHRRLAGADSRPRPVDCIQFFVDASVRRQRQEPWTTRKIVQVLLGVWFASVHQPAMSLVYALDDLCSHPHYINQLRSEITAGMDEGRSLDSLPLLDSFLRESARLNPSDSISVRRKVLQPFTFKDGTHLVQNDVACIPLLPILRDPSIYKNPLEFDAFRFMSDATGARETAQKFTYSNVQFPLWGLGKRTCPGRYYASRVLKLTLAHILLHYDIRMANDGHYDRRRRRFFWRSSIVPRSDAVLLFRERHLLE